MESDLPIREYGVIGNCETAALVNSRGGIDWMCLPAFDAPSFFGALLDRERGGEFVLRPISFDRVEQRYLDDTAILETTFHCGERQVVLTDFFVIARPKKARFYDFTSLYPTRKLVRLIRIKGEGAEGSAPVRVEMRLAARPDYGRREPGWERKEERGFQCPEAGFVSSFPVKQADDDLLASFDLYEGRECFAVLDYSDDPPEPTAERVRGWLNVSQAFWEEWSLFNYYSGSHEKMIRRSLVTLKLLTYAPTGAFVAAATTSLPEWPGGDLNWDYRYTWVRDTALFINTLFRLGYSGEAKAFFNFISSKCKAGRLHQEDGRIEVLFPIREGSPTDEEFLDHLSGYRGSRPIRAGNRAAKQFQLDNFGHLLQSLFYWHNTGGKLNSSRREMLEELVAGLLKNWKQPDDGIWELEGRRHYTFGKVMAWAGLRRACELGVGDQEELIRVRDQIAGEVMQKSLHNGSGKPYLAAAYNVPEVDASDLLAFTMGFLPQELARNTRQTIEARLGKGSLLRRSEFIEQKEGAFLICSFWLINHLIMEGELKRAESLLEEIIGQANHLGLYAEEIDPETGDFLGNFPQAFSHLGLIESVLNLEQAKTDPEFAKLPDHEKFQRSVGATIGFKGVIAGFRRAPRTARLLLSNRSKWTAL